MEQRITSEIPPESPRTLLNRANDTTLPMQQRRRAETRYGELCSQFLATGDLYFHQRRQSPPLGSVPRVMGGPYVDFRLDDMRVDLSTAPVEVIVTAHADWMPPNEFFRLYTRFDHVEAGNGGTATFVGPVSWQELCALSTSRKVTRIAPRT